MRPTTPALLAASGARQGIAMPVPITEEMSTTDPRPAPTMRTPTARQQRKTPEGLTSITASQSSSVIVAPATITLQCFTMARSTAGFNGAILAEQVTTAAKS